MESSELKKLIINSLNNDTDPAESCKRLQDKGVSFSFSNGFTDRVLDALAASGLMTMNKNEIEDSIRIIFYRIAIGGVAAILILFVSIMLSEESFSLNSLLGLSNSYDESIFCLLTGK